MKADHARIYMVALWLLTFLTACSSEETASTTKGKKKTVKVAVLAESYQRERWERTAAWALRNIRDAQQGMEEIVDLQLVFKNQDDADIIQYMEKIAADDDIDAIIGPTTTACTASMADILDRNKSGKPMISPTATGIEYQRRNAPKPYVWNMAESDVAQIEVLVSEIAARQYGYEKPVMLMVYDGEDEGTGSHNAYMEWFGFVAEEYGLHVDGVHCYRTEEDVRRIVRQICGTSSKYARKSLVFCPSSPEMALAMDDEIGKMKAELGESHYLYTPQFHCSDSFVDERIAQNCTHADYEGVDLYAAPESGFHIAYRQRFGENLVNGEAQLYDAICLLAYAAALPANLATGLNDAVMKVVDGRDGKGYGWVPADMRYNFLALMSGRTPDIDGVSGSWTFDEKTHSSVVESTFRRWKLSSHRFLTSHYVSTEGSKRTSSSKNFWEWTASNMQQFEHDDGSGVEYPELDERWALLVAASKGWANYRFQADIFAMYRLLRRHGYDDDHIVLITEDDVPNHPNNPQPGTLRISDEGENLYVPAAIDYRLNQLVASDIGEILRGRSSERLPHVIRADEDDNIFIFWSGHGSIGSLDFGGNDIMSYGRMREMLSLVPHRKLLFTVEACYSGGLGEECKGLPGALLITAANPYETSHADVWSENTGVYLSNGFTRGFQEAIDKDAGITLRDLYYTLASRTAGSHVKVYNSGCYGSVYSNTMGEFLK